MKPQNYIKLLLALFLCIEVQAQVKIGANPNTIQAGALLELESGGTNLKGLLHSRVSLLSTTIWGLNGTSVNGMMVYNTNAAIAQGSTAYPTIKGGKGIYYWDGNGWVATKYEMGTSTLQYGAGAPSGACTGDVIYVDTLENSATEGQSWTCDNGTWISYTPKEGTEWMFAGTTNDAGSSKTAKIWRKNFVGVHVGTQVPFSPNSCLHVLNNASSNLSSDNLIIESFGGSGQSWPSFMSFFNLGTKGAHLPATDDMQLGLFSGGTRNGAGVLKSTAFMRVSADGDHTATSVPSKLSFATTNDNSTTSLYRMTIKKDGYVGIGTEDPTSGLTILGEDGSSYLDAGGGNDIRMIGYKGTGTNASATLIFEHNGGAQAGSTSATRLLSTGNVLGSIVMGNKDQASAGMFNAVATENWTTASHGTQLRFYTTPSGATTNAMRMVIDDNGYVGINTAVPNANLSINSNIDATNTSNGVVCIGDQTAQRVLIDNNEILCMTATGVGNMNINGTPNTGIPSGNTGIGHDGTSTVLNVWGAGRVGILRGPTTNELEVNGNASKAVAGSWLANSDSRLKKNINYLNADAMLQKVLEMKGVTYEWNDDKTGTKRPEGTQFGFIAQDLQKVFPSKVTEDNYGYLQTAYGDYDFLFVEAIKALNQKISDLQKENAQLKASASRVEALENEMEGLKASIQQLIPSDLSKK